MDIDPTTVGAVLVVLAPMAIFLVYLFVLPDGVGLEDVGPLPRELDRPPCVQETDPVRWGVESPTTSDRWIPSALPALEVKYESSDPARPGTA